MSRFTRPVHTFSSVIQELFEGLNNGSITLGSRTTQEAEPPKKEDKQRLTQLPADDVLNTVPININPEFLMDTNRQQAGPQLCALRERLGLTLQDVEASSSRIAKKYRNIEYEISAEKLADIELHSFPPSIYSLYSLSVIYRVDLQEIFVCFGLDLSTFAQDASLSSPPKSNLMTMPDGIAHRNVPPVRTVAKYGGVLGLFLLDFGTSRNTDISYAHIGFEDFTMYPILPPGAFVQVDKSRRQIREMRNKLSHDSERPIYFVETKDGFTCCWCTLDGDNLVLQPHPQSLTLPRVAKWPDEARIIGEVVAAVKRLDLAIEIS